jgi:hypothetical protein
MIDFDNKEIVQMLSLESGIPVEKINKADIRADEWIVLAMIASRISADIEYYRKQHKDPNYIKIFDSSR